VELVAPLKTGIGLCILPPTSATLEEDTITVSSAYSLPMAPTAENIIENARKTGAQMIMSVPTFLDAWATEANDETLSLLRRMRFVGFGGGPLAYEKGQFLTRQGVKLRSLYGGTEVRFQCLFFTRLQLMIFCEGGYGDTSPCTRGSRP
jgi:acyl-coenzyme A synthetase/AMP-(fatty) acid ligase